MAVNDIIFYLAFPSLNIHETQSKEEVIFQAQKGGATKFPFHHIHAHCT